MDEEKIQNPEIPKSTESWKVLKGDATQEEILDAMELGEEGEEETEQISEEHLESVKGSLLAMAETTEGETDSLEERLTNPKVLESFGPLASPDADMGVALQHEGISPALLARKLKILLESVEPKWNLKLKKWDYFIPSELWRRCIEMIMKVRGDFAPEKRININTDVTLEELLLSSKGMTPEEAKAKIVDYIDVEVINP